MQDHDMDTSDSSQPNPAPPAARRRTRRDPPQLLTHAQQELFLKEIERGLSVSHACRKLDLLPGDVDQTLRKDPGFAGLCAFAQKLLTGDIEMAAYATALKGTAAAQALYLRFHPPSAGENRLHDDHFDEYSDAELIDLMRKQGISIPPELMNDES
jgi:hypothetical protein